MRDLREAALRAYEANFGDRDSMEFNGDMYFIERTPRVGLRFVEVDELSFPEQNPRKASHWSKMVREGHMILWAVRGRRYLATVRDGKFHDFRKRD